MYTLSIDAMFSAWIPVNPYTLRPPGVFSASRLALSSASGASKGSSHCSTKSAPQVETLKTLTK